MTVIDEGDERTKPNALAINGSAAEWVADRRNIEDWTAERQAELDAWLAQSLAHRVAYIRIEATWRRTDRLAALRRSIHEHKAILPSRHAFRIRITIALGLVVIIAGAVTEIILTRTIEQTFATTIGAREQVILNDGSRIELNTDTLLRVSLNENMRSITLDKGEAYFQIRHDATHPFTVVAGQHRITDLGTQFSVRRDLDRLKVSLIEGRARFETTGTNASASSLELSPGDEIVATLDGVTLVKKPVAMMKIDLEWRRGVVVFNNTSLADAAAEFNRYSRTKLVFADQKVASLTIMGTFQTNNVEAFADVLQAALGLRAEDHNETIIISR